jgi:hypothetical protein
VPLIPETAWVFNQPALDFSLMSAKESTQVRALVVALFVALLAFAVFYNAFLRIFIKYWEWTARRTRNEVHPLG